MMIKFLCMWNVALAASQRHQEKPFDQSSHDIGGYPPTHEYQTFFRSVNHRSPYYTHINMNGYSMNIEHCSRGNLVLYDEHGSIQNIYPELYGQSIYGKTNNIQTQTQVKTPDNVKVQSGKCPVICITQETQKESSVNVDHASETLNNSNRASSSTDRLSLNINHLTRGGQMMQSAISFDYMKIINAIFTIYEINIDMSKNSQLEIKDLIAYSREVFINSFLQIKSSRAKALEMYFRHSTPREDLQNVHILLTEPIPKDIRANIFNVLDKLLNIRQILSNDALFDIEKSDPLVCASKLNLATIFDHEDVTDSYSLLSNILLLFFCDNTQFIEASAILRYYITQKISHFSGAARLHLKSFKVLVRRYYYITLVILTIINFGKVIDPVVIQAINLRFTESVRDCFKGEVSFSRNFRGGNKIHKLIVDYRDKVIKSILFQSKDEVDQYFQVVRSY